MDTVSAFLKKYFEHSKVPEPYSVAFCLTCDSTIVTQLAVVEDSAHTYTEICPYCDHQLVVTREV